MPSEFDLYQMVLRAHLGNFWKKALPVVDFANTFDARNAPITEMTVRVRDQAELIGLLNEMHDFGLALISLELVGRDHE